ncbi:MAG TPA: nuclear transport factor 2 family protein [Vitreimonas sp.]|uniref:nuclear transport factor 2 family protein n=1 Tax=Vitreimonas sp. TaxID=3069702 RepID=UPI002D6CE9D7|nr:nuclear transport factor 2 family protein [Vitreimonas sp.]HYD86305.1 nuclear transport factor 2 family protein [Vitreimonas sp.]
MVMFDRRRRFDLARAFAALVAVMLPLNGCSARADGQAEESATLARLIARAESANEAFINGDMRRWYEIVGPISEDFTLMQPSGGVSRGFSGTDERLDELARVFTRGEATFEFVEGYVSGDMAVLVFIERQRAVIAGLPEQDWSLRVTQVWRRRGGAWELVHRHADTLVDNIGMDRTAELARAG